MLTLTSPIETPLHRVPVGPKLLALLATTCGLYALQSPVALVCALAGVIGLHLPGGPRFWRFALRQLRPLWVFVVIILVWHGLTDEWEAGLTILLRMVTAVAAANLVTMTSRLSDMIGILERLCRPVGAIIPPRRLAMAIALVIRFIPVLSERTNQLIEAFRARSSRRPGWRIIAPAALAALDNADHAAEALRARGGTE